MLDDRRSIARISSCTLALLGLIITLPLTAVADPCEVDDAGGTVVLPPAGCDYLSPHEVHIIIGGLPPGTTIELKPIHKDFICDEQGNPICSALIPPGLCEAPGGGLGGNVDCFNSTLQLEVKGTGLLAGFNRTLNIPAATEVHTGPRNPGDPVQTFPTEMVSLQADLFGDPDFDFLQIRAGSSFGLPSPGETTLTQLPTGRWHVDSSFDINYEIDFQGAPGSILEGMAGSTSAGLQMVATNVNPCDVVDNGTGTVDLPPVGCEYHSPFEVHQIISGLPPGTTIELAAIHRNFICSNPIGTCTIALPGGVCEGPGGSLGGNVDCFQSEAQLTITGTGSLAGFNRSITVQLDTEVHTGPRNPGDPVQSFPSQMFRLQGELFGDPDFCTLRLRAGDQLGLPSPGMTVLTDKGDGTFAVDSFFDITYKIDFVGCPGSFIEGFGGTSIGRLRMQARNLLEAGPVPALTRPSWLAMGALLLCVGAFAILRGRPAAKRGL